MYYALIMAGGSGTRLWPLSRKNRPKQSLPLVSERTMFQISVERLAPLIPPERVFVVTNAEMAQRFSEQEPDIPARNYVVEPSAKDSGPAAGLGLAHIAHADPDATVAILAADHHIGDEPAFLNALQAAHDVAQNDVIVTLGITPTHASSSFGYIERGSVIAIKHGLRVYNAAKFTEKPSTAVAEAWLSGGRHSWNSGMFIQTAKTGLAEFDRQQPAFAATLRELGAAVGTDRYETALQAAWAVAPKKSLDYAIMEGAQRIAVIPVDIGWSDIGNWASLLEVQDRDGNGNVIVGDHVGVDTEGSLVRAANRLVVTIGVRNLVIVDTEDALLVAPVERVHEVKQIVDELRAQNRHDVL